MEVFEGNPIGKFAWSNMWKLPIFARGEQGTPIKLGDSAYILRKNIEQIYGDEASIDGAQVATGSLDETMGDTMHLGLHTFFQKVYKEIYGGESTLHTQHHVIDEQQVMEQHRLEVEAAALSRIRAPKTSIDLSKPPTVNLAGDTMHLGLWNCFMRFGGVFKLCFGPKSFLVVSDPVVARSVLRDNSKKYDKGMLAELLFPIMGKGLIPADQETWKVRRRAIVPGFHQKWLDRMVSLYAECTQVLLDKLEAHATNKEVIAMETEFCSVSLDIIGKAVFNYDFGSVTKESPVIKAVYSTLQEVEHRSQMPLPYWEIPGASLFVPRLRRFNENLKLLNDILDELIEKAMATSHKTDLEELQNKNYDAVQDPSLLRFLVDMRGESSTCKQLRDDLMTMLIAGHETTAAVLTWALFELAQNPELVQKVQAEIDEVCGDRMPTWADIKELKLVRLCLAESLRMYPEPPLLIRRALEDDKFPAGTAGFEANVVRGQDLFISVYNIHRNPDFWPNPDKYDPERFLRPFKNPNVKDWAGYDPEIYTSNPSLLYPNEVASDFAFLPFGGGARKCVGDQFAFLEATVCLAAILRRYEFDFDGSPDDVGMATGATIHTKNNLKMHVRKRTNIDQMQESRHSNQSEVLV
jgi:cytochrome P450